jgi:hypothetical protein
VLALLLDHGADPNQGDGNGKSPLHYAINTLNPTIVALLLEKGADLNDFDNSMNGQSSPLQDALSMIKPKHRGYKSLGSYEDMRVFEIVRLLVAAGARIQKLGKMERKLVTTICEGWQQDQNKQIESQEQDRLEESGDEGDQTGERTGE